jgi:hypothetical protein
VNQSSDMPQVRQIVRDAASGYHFFDIVMGS